MRDNKKFFNNNYLNKGYRKQTNSGCQRRNDEIRKNNHALPPIGMLEQYEEIYPGTLKKIIQMSEIEQSHKHQVNLLNIKKYCKMNVLGKIIGLLFIIVVSITSVFLAVSSLLLAALFAFSAFTCVAITSYVFSNRMFKGKKPTCNNFTSSGEKLYKDISTKKY